MNKTEDLKNILHHLQFSEGADFHYDEASILAEVQHRENNTATLAIKILSILGGLIATMAFLGFLFLTGIAESSIGLVVVGIAFICGGLFITKMTDNLVLDTACIMLYVTGYLMFGAGLSDFNVQENVMAILFMVIAVVALFFSQNYVLAFLSTLIISSAFLFLIGNNEIFSTIHFYLALMVAVVSFFYLNEAKIISTSPIWSQLYNPVRIGLVFSLIMGLMFVGTRNLTGIHINYVGLSSITTIGAVLYMVFLILKKFEINDNLIVAGIYGATVLALLPTIFAPAIAGAILIILLSFYVNYKTSFVLGILCFIYFLSQYYYDLKLTLLAKSGILFLSGILFMLCFLYLHKYLTSDEKV